MPYDNDGLTRRYALIMAAGEGRRAGSDIPKQFVELLGIPMLWWSVMAFARADRLWHLRRPTDPPTKIIVVLHPGFFDDWDIMLRELPSKLAAIGLPENLGNIDVQLSAGGRSRSESVSHGLMSVPSDSDTLVAIHDAARPLVTPEFIDRCWDSAMNEGVAVPATPVTDSLRTFSTEDRRATIPADRSRFVAVQTPQIFRADSIIEAFRITGAHEYTDEASRWQDADPAHHIVNPIEGLTSNMKVTNPDDFDIAALLLEKSFRQNFIS